MIGQTVSHYRIMQKLGQGGMGEVFLAHDMSLDREVAIKFLPRSLERDETARRRFLREARSAAALDHPYICGIHEVGEAEGKNFIVMEYLQGRTLENRLAEGAVPLKEAMQYALEITEALVAAHAKGIIHRDLKPGNIMLLGTGHAKVMDFGLAKQVSLAAPPGSREDTLTGALTVEGTTVGTLAYMSPEQVKGRPTDLRSDLFSLGIVLYEMLSGIHPFKKDSGFDTADAILREAAVPLADHRGDAPPPLAGAVDRLLAKKPEDRYQQAEAVARDIRRAIEEASGKQAPGTPAAFAAFSQALKKPAYWIPLALVLAAAAYAAVQGAQSYRKGRWAREVAPGEVERLIELERPVAGARVLEEAARFAPGSRELDRLRTMIYLEADLRIETTPPAAEIYIRDYSDVEENGPSRWDFWGRSPHSAKTLIGHHRFRVALEGFEPVEFASGSGTVRLQLHPREAIPAGMVHVSGIDGGRIGPVAAPGKADAFWIDQHEVTNREFKEFVDAGGYRKKEYWRHPFILGGKELSWEAAMGMFCDPTGMPGPSAWEFGTYPEGKAEWPVGGVSWFEAAAYAEFAGKSLPTIFHWFHAAGFGISANILRFSNFSGKGPAAIGAYRGLGRFGTYDMAGNVKEWCSNAIDDARYILGGAWNEPDYQFFNGDARRPFEREAAFGFRCARYTAPLPGVFLDPVPGNWFITYDRRQDKPADDQAYRIYSRLHSYEKTDLEPALELADETSSQFWRMDKVTFRAAYGNERVIAELYLPKNSSPPYQAVLYFPGAGALVQKKFSGFDSFAMHFILRSGRAFMVPSYKGTLERGPSKLGKLDSETRLHWSKDLGRSIDYLETRPDIDVGKLAYFGFSLGASVGPRLVAMEPRIKVAVLGAGGSVPVTEGEVDSWNFAPRVRVPVLMLNGRSDLIFPLETSQRPLFHMLGTPEKDKVHKLYEGGHDIFSRMDVFKDMQEWLDRYLGPVQMKPNP